MSVEFAGSCSNSLLDRTIRTLLSGWQVLIKTFPSLASDKCKPKMLHAASWADISVALINLLSECGSNHCFSNQLRHATVGFIYVVDYITTTGVSI